ncbi:hypothetical protein Lser_V15G14889 [Lactuca serriola]
MGGTTKKKLVSSVESMGITLMNVHSKQGCYECNEKGHFKQDFPQRRGTTKPNVPLKHYERCDEEVTCYKCGKNGNYANVFTSSKRFCYGCRDKGHISKDCPKKSKAARADAPPKPRSIPNEAADNAMKSED